MLVRADKFDLGANGRRSRALIAHRALDVRLDVRPSRPGVAGCKRALELRRDWQASAARRSDEIVGTLTIRIEVRAVRADISLRLGIGIGRRRVQSEAA